MRRAVTSAIAFFFATTILFVSVMRTAAVKYEYSMPPNGNGLHPEVLGAETVNINYNLAYPGKINPDHVLWPIKALRDKIWLTITTNPSRRAELNLLFADKRLSSAKILFEKGKFEKGYSTLTKAEKYLEEACEQEYDNRKEGIDTSEFLLTLSTASLKHQQVIEEIKGISPEDALPDINKIKDYAANTYEKSMHALNEKGMEAPINPFDRN